MSCEELNFLWKILVQEAVSNKETQLLYKFIKEACNFQLEVSFISSFISFCFNIQCPFRENQ